MRLIELDAKGWKSPTDFLQSLARALGSCEGHGMSPLAALSSRLRSLTGFTGVAIKFPAGHQPCWSLSTVPAGTPAILLDSKYFGAVAIQCLRVISSNFPASQV